MTFEEWIEHQPDGIAACDHITFGMKVWVAGAASRDTEIESLRQQLHNEKERCDAYLDDVKRLEGQLAPALAACKLKDEALNLLVEDMGDELSVWDSSKQKAIIALAIQPDDSALKELLGEPVAWMWIDRKGWRAFGIEPHDTIESTPLYTPKGMPK